jgi:hypothetical protein
MPSGLRSLKMTKAFHNMNFFLRREKLNNTQQQQVQWVRLMVSGSRRLDSNAASWWAWLFSGRSPDGKKSIQNAIEVETEREWREEQRKEIQTTSRNLRVPSSSSLEKPDELEIDVPQHYGKKTGI